MDLDIGQSEFGLPGVVALAKLSEPILAPAFLRKCQIIK